MTEEKKIRICFLNAWFTSLQIYLLVHNKSVFPLSVPSASKWHESTALHWSCDTAPLPSRVSLPYQCLPLKSLISHSQNDSTLAPNALLAAAQSMKRPLTENHLTACSVCGPFSHLIHCSWTSSQTIPFNISLLLKTLMTFLLLHLLSNVSEGKLDFEGVFSF